MILQVTDRTVVCSEHFDEHCFYRRAGYNPKRRILAPTAVPTKFQWHQSPKKRRPLIRVSRPAEQSDSERTITATSESEPEPERYQHSLLRLTMTASLDVNKPLSYSHCIIEKSNNNYGCRDRVICYPGTRPGSLAYPGSR